jgi:predicted DNA repair protein MutK
MAVIAQFLKNTVFNILLLLGSKYISWRCAEKVLKSWVSENKSLGNGEREKPSGYYYTSAFLRLKIPF